MKHIAIECESIEQDHWGIARIVRGFLCALARRTDLVEHYRFHLFFHRQIPDGPWNNNPLFVLHKLAAPRWLGKHGSFSLYYYWLLPLATWQEHFDLTIFPNYMLPVGVRGRTATLLTEDVHREMTNDDVPLRYRVAYRIFCNHAARTSDRIIAISESSAQNLARVFRIPRDRIVVCYPGIVASISDQLPQSSWPTLISRGRRFLLFVAQMFPRRHARELIQAFRQIMHDQPGLDLVLIGPDRYQPPMVTRTITDMPVETQNRIYHYDFIPQDELDRLLSHAAAFVYVSSTEAFGFPPLEALARGTTPIVADTPVSHELLGSSALYIHNPESVEETATAIREALERARTMPLPKQTNQATLRRFHWDGFADSMLSMIHELVRT